MVIAHGDVVWVDFGSPHGLEPTKRRPAVVMQENWLLATEIPTVLVVPLTSKITLEAFPGNVLVPVDASELGRDFVAVVSQVDPVSREFVEPYPVGHVTSYVLSRVAGGG